MNKRMESPALFILLFILLSRPNFCFANLKRAQGFVS
jgi:hypothetical protein